MSIRVMTAVWDHAAVEGGTLLVLLAMADWANDDGTGVYPTQETLARKARLGDRQVRNCLAELEDLGYIKRDGKRGHVVNWWVDPDPANIAGRQPIAGSSGTGVPTEPSTEPPEEEANASPSKSPGNSDDAGTNTEVPPPATARYLEPASPGAAAAPWLALELARLMRLNDPKAKLPVGLRELMAPEYLEALGRPGGEWSTREKRRELIAPVAGKPALAKWLDSMRLLVDTDEREAREVAQVVRWCQGDDFWKGNILSADKFRKQYPKLRARWLEENGGAGATSGVTNRPPDRGPSTAAQLDALAGRR
jgi:hypothetical protein